MLTIFFFFYRSVKRSVSEHIISGSFLLVAFNYRSSYFSEPLTHSPPHPSPSPTTLLFAIKRHDYNSVQQEWAAFNNSCNISPSVG